jgi:hypothetical protein
MDKLKVFSGKMKDNFQIWHKSVKTYFQYEKKNFTVDTDKINYLGSQLEGKALIWDQSHEEQFEMSDRWDSSVQYQEALCECILSAEQDK